MNRQNIIIVIKGDSYEAWGSLKEICENHNLPYWTLARMTFPINYEEYKFVKVPFRRVAKK